MTNAELIDAILTGLCSKQDADSLADYVAQAFGRPGFFVELADAATDRGMALDVQMFAHICDELSMAYKAARAEAASVSQRIQ